MSRRKRPTGASEPPVVGQAGRTQDEVPAQGSDAAAVPGLPAFLAGVLLTARYFLPAESAALGETLWIVQFWLIAAVLWLWSAARNGLRLRRPDLLDLALALLIGGHIISAVLVLATEGDRRAALNMLWEWIGTGVAAMMIREVVRRPEGREQLKSVVVLCAITLSGLGIWQHYVWYPAVAEKLAEYDRLSVMAPAALDEAARRQDRLQNLRRELGPLVTADDPAANQLLRARIAASTEPIGRFALANTFAGILVAGLLLAMGQLLQSATRRNWRWWIGGLLVVAVMDCLWLTKSRTAMIGLLAGLTAWGMTSGRRGWGHSPVRWATWAFGIVLLALPVVAGLSGSLDREVITEAPKSLQYRLEYWTTTGAIIREHPLLGVGPGNFRQAYLAHKLAGSSEEVLDPHNLFLDVWANGGLLALTGLLLTSLLAGRRMLESLVAGAGAGPMPPAPGGAAVLVWRLGVGLLAIGAASFVELMNGSGFSTGGWWLLLGWCAVSFLWPRSEQRSAIEPAVVAATIALIVHLLGAGGIAMPAILQTLVLLVSLLSISPTPGAAVATGFPQTAEDAVPWRTMAGAAGCLCLAIACAFSATLPVSASRTQMELGRAILAEGNLPLATRSFQQAIDADPLAADPWQELAVALLLDWGRLAGSDEELIRQAIAAQEEAIAHDPHAADRWRALGDLRWRKYLQDRHPQSGSQAVAAFRQAVSLYPNLSRLQAELARTAAATGQPDVAREAARRAVALDDLNRQHGHADKYLSNAERTMVERIAAGEDVEP